MKKQKYTLHLQADGTIKPGVLRIPQPDSILSIILPSGSPFHHPDTVIWSNVPQKDGKPQKISRTPGPYSLLWDLQFDLLLTQPGPYYIYVQHGHNKNCSQHTYFTIDPVLHIRGSPVPISSFIIQTNFARCIGTVDQWVRNLRCISDLGYNMIHLPPIQKIGATSLYSISNFLELSPSLFNGSVSQSERWPLMKRIVAKIEDELGIVFMNDVVLNHINTNSPILIQNPDLAYNVNNSPYLKPALFIDDMILQLSNDIADRKTKIDPKAPDCSMIKKLLYERIVHSEFHNFYTLDKDRCLALFRSTKSEKTGDFDDLKHLSLDEKKKWFLNNCVVDDGKYEISKSVSFIPEFAHALFDRNETEFLDAVDYANLPRYHHVDSIVHDIVENTVNLFQGDFHHITRDRPIVWQYFSKFCHVPVACNGFLMAGKPTDDFMDPHSEAFVRRQINIWGDCAKLRYGKSPEDNPPLWRMMENYITSCASISAALRIDNAHSTPIEVAEYMLAAARRVNPNLYVMAELFTDDQNSAFNYINRIGINAFMKEGCYGRDVWSMNHLINGSGGRSLVPIDSMNYITEILPESRIPSVVFDLTHDNMDTSFDHGLISAGCSMAVGPSASTRGYDDILQWNPHCTQEFRLYPVSNTFPALHPLKQALNKLHFEMGILGMNEIQTFVHDSILSIFRHNSETGEGRFMLINFGDNCDGKMIQMPDGFEGFCFEARVENVNYNSHKCTTTKIVPSDAQIYLNFQNPKKCHHDPITNSIVLDRFPCGTIVVFKTGLSKKNVRAIDSLASGEIISRLMDGIHNENPDLLKLANLLFSCESEEQENYHSGSYQFRGYNTFYAGIQGIKKAIEVSTDMGSSVFENMKEGDWLIDYILGRMERIGFDLLTEIVEQFVTIAKRFPKMYRPRFISRIIYALDFVAKQCIISKFSNFVRGNNEFVQDLAICSLQFLVPVPNSPLLSRDIFQKLFRNENLSDEISHPELSMAAGLPHFSTSWCRSWGRDTFISLRGLLLIPGRFDIAKSHLIAFASVEKHGLIPNLMMGASNPRYNARDATWFFLQALQDYHSFISMKKNSYTRSISKDDYYNDNIFDWIVPSYSENGKEVVVRTMGEVIQEIMQCHADGIHFRDSAGDDCIREEGRQIDIGTDWNTGLIYGGNQWNCGTWMDKMGSSASAGNRGFPATPRNGAAVEINGLLASTLKWLEQVNLNNEFAFKGVKQITYHDWYHLLLKNFEKSFWINEKNHYRDTIGASNPSCDLQLRPNFVIPMAVCPDLFTNVENARKALDIVSTKLLSKIGLRTLDPDDPNYRPNYCSSNQGDFLVADGFNYHNGPPWVWPVGYYCRAMINFCRDKMDRVMEVIANLRRDLKENPASGIEELTYENGDICNDGCKTQAWSVATILDFLYDFNASFISN